MNGRWRRAMGACAVTLSAAVLATLDTQPLAGAEVPLSAKSLSRSFLLSLAAPPEIVFPLFGPEGEKQWVDGWNPEFVRCEGGCNGEGTIFRTRDGDQQTIWFVRHFDAEKGFAEMILVNPENRLTLLRIEVEGGAPGRSVARVSYEWTALTESGSRAVEMHAGELFHQYMKLWEAAMNHYLTTGRSLPDSRQLSGARPQAKPDKGGGQ
ncbi:MAG: hypothetical protein AB1714_09600 [Acidobacteriota bacterium]